MDFEKNESKKEYASKAVAGTALGLGIAGTTIGLLGGNCGGFGNLFGRGIGCGNVAAIGTGVLGAEAAMLYADSNQRSYEQRVFSELTSNTKDMFGLALNTEHDLRGVERNFLENVIETERRIFAGERQLDARIDANREKAIYDVFDAVKKQDSDKFELYRYARDNKDELAERISALEKQVAVHQAIVPYQNAMLSQKIDNVAVNADFNLFRRTCNMISGHTVLVSTPTVTGIRGASYVDNGCTCDLNATHPA